MRVAAQPGLSFGCRRGLASLRLESEAEIEADITLNAPLTIGAVSPRYGQSRAFQEGISKDLQFLVPSF